MKVEREDVKKVLLELFNEDGEEREGKKFVFPRNVEASYNLIPGLTGMDAIKYISIPAIISILILAIPPYSVAALWIIKVIVVLLIMACGFILAIARPIRFRNNIRCVEHIKTILSFYSRQKKFFLRPKKRGEIK